MMNNMIQFYFISCCDYEFVYCNWCDCSICYLFINMALDVKLGFSKHVLILVFVINSMK